MRPILVKYQVFSLGIRYFVLMKILFCGPFPAITWLHNEMIKPKPAGGYFSGFYTGMKLFHLITPP
jgi:hypothetical protein